MCATPQTAVLVYYKTTVVKLCDGLFLAVSLFTLCGQFLLFVFFILSNIISFSDNKKKKNETLIVSSKCVHGVLLPNY